MPIEETIGYYSSYTGRKISSIVNKYCKDLNVKIILSAFKLSTMLSPKDFIPDSLKSRVVYQVIRFSGYQVDVHM